MRRTREELQFRTFVKIRGLSARIAAAQSKEREDRRERRSRVITGITELKSELAGALEACPFPSYLSETFPSPVKERWQRAFDAIDPFAGDGEVRLKQLLGQVQVYRAEASPFRASFSFDAVFPGGPGHAEERRGPGFVERRQLTETLLAFEKRLEMLIRYSGWWQG